MTESDYIDYFKTIASSHVDIQHDDDNNKAFIVISGLQIPAGFDTVEDQIIMALDIPDSGINPVPDNRLDVKTGGLSILKRCSAGDTDNIDSIIDECEAVCRQVAAKIYEDSQQFETIKEFKLEKLLFTALRPDAEIFPGWIGMRMDFELRASDENNYYNPEKWL